MVVVVVVVDSTANPHSLVSALPLSRGGHRPPLHTEGNGGKGCRESSGEWSNGVVEHWVSGLGSFIPSAMLDQKAHRLGLQERTLPGLAIGSPPPPPTYSRRA